AGGLARGDQLATGSNVAGKVRSGRVDDKRDGRRVRNAVCGNTGERQWIGPRRDCGIRIHRKQGCALACGDGRWSKDGTCPVWQTREAKCDVVFRPEEWTDRNRVTRVCSRVRGLRGRRTEPGEVGSCPCRKEEALRIRSEDIQKPVAVEISDCRN